MFEIYKFWSPHVKEYWDMNFKFSLRIFFFFDGLWGYCIDMVKEQLLNILVKSTVFVPNMLGGWSFVIYIYIYILLLQKQKKQKKLFLFPIIRFWYLLKKKKSFEIYTFHFKFFHFCFFINLVSICICGTLIVQCNVSQLSYDWLQNAYSMFLIQHYMQK